MMDDRIPFEYLLEGSERSLQDAMLKRLEIASAKRKEIHELLEEWAEERTRALIFEWFLVNGSELAARLTGSPTVTMLPSVPGPEKPGPIRAIDFRESLRRLLESA